MTQDNPQDMAALDDLLADAAKEPATVPLELTARVLADAATLQPKAAVAMAKSPSVWARITASLGGWPGIGGLAAATCAGFWIGINPPVGMPDAAAVIWGEQLALLDSEAAELSGFGWDLGEE